MLELPSTAMLAPWATVSAELLAEMADFKATFVPAANPFTLKHFDPDFNCPLDASTNNYMQFITK